MSIVINNGWIYIDTNPKSDFETKLLGAKNKYFSKFNKYPDYCGINPKTYEKVSSEYRKYINLHDVLVLHDVSVYPYKLVMENSFYLGELRDAQIG